jgi:hypothetical protein
MPPDTADGPRRSVRTTADATGELALGRGEELVAEAQLPGPVGSGLPPVDLWRLFPKVLVERHATEK